jgi:hypothetical protein
MKTILKRSLSIADRFFRSLFTVLFPRGWIVFILSILLVLCMTMLMCAYVEGGEDLAPAAKHHGDCIKIEAAGFHDDAGAANAGNQVVGLNKPLIWLEIVISLLAVGVLACVIAHKVKRKRRIRLVLAILLALKITIVLICGLKIVMRL